MALLRADEIISEESSSSFYRGLRVHLDQSCNFCVTSVSAYSSNFYFALGSRARYIFQIVRNYIRRERDIGKRKAKEASRFFTTPRHRVELRKIAVVVEVNHVESVIQQVTSHQLTLNISVTHACNINHQRAICPKQRTHNRDSYRVNGNTSSALSRR